MARMVYLRDEPFRPAEFVDRFTKVHSGLGALSSFVGLVRDDSTAQDGSSVEALELSHYEQLTLPGLEALASRTIERFSLMGVLIAHRTGTMQAGEPIVLVAAAARHRREAIEAVAFAMDHLKSDSWFWKREKRAGAWQWIEPREVDHTDLARWS